MTATSITDVLPSPEGLSPRAVAVITHVPSRLRTVTTAELSRAIGQAAAQSGLKSAPTPGEPKYEAMAVGALGELLDGAWIQGQAAEMGIALTRREVVAEFTRIKQESFKTEKEFHAFLQRSRLTLKDVHYRVRLQLLTTAMQERVTRKALRSGTDAETAFAAFVAAYTQRWRSRTVCAVQYATERCSNGPPPETEPMLALPSRP